MAVTNDPDDGKYTNADEKITCMKMFHQNFLIAHLMLNAKNNAF